MRSIKLLSIFILTTLLFTGCVKPKLPKQASFPNWYTNPPKNDSTFIYGVGEGVNKKTSVDSALDALASKLSVSIESSFENRKNIYKSEAGESFSQDITKDIKSQVEKITFNNYEVVQLKEVRGELLSLVKVDKNRLFQRKKKEYDSVKRVLKETFNSLESKDPITKLKEFKSFNKQSEKAITLSYLLNTLNPNFSIERDLKTFENYKTEEKRTKSKIEIFIETDRASKLLLEPLKVALNKEKIKVLNRKKSSRNVVILKINSRDKQAKAMRYFVTKKSVTLDLINNHRNTVASNKLTLVGKSTLDYKQSQESVSRALDKEISKRGILQIIGIDK